MVVCSKMVVAGMGVLIALPAAAANCGIEALDEAAKFGYSYKPAYFDISKNYELNKPFALQSGNPLIYRKMGKRDSYLVAPGDVTYKSDWFLAIKFKLAAGRRYQAYSNTKGAGGLRVIRQSGGSGNTQLLYVNKDGELCERVGSYSQPSGGLSAITTLVKGNYVAEPELRFAQEDVVDSSYAKAVSIVLEEDGPSLWRLKANYFSNDNLVATRTKELDKNAESMLFEGYTIHLAKTAKDGYEATVVGEPSSM